MATPGKIATQGKARQMIFDTKKGNARWFRITNTSMRLMGVTFTDVDGAADQSAVISPGLSMDFIAIKLEIRDDSGGGVEGSYEALP